MIDIIGLEDLTSRRILVIDDEEANLLLLQTLLEREGYKHVVYVCEPTKAIEELIRFQPHLILLDLMMPDIDGYQLLEAFRKHSQPDEFRPVLVLTADTTIEARRRALALGAKDFLSKPFDVIEIGLRIANLLETQILYDRLQNKA